MKRRSVQIAVLLAVCLAMTGCGNQTTEPEETQPAAEIQQIEAEETAETAPAHEEETLNAVLTAEELSNITTDYPNLKELDVSGSTCYDAILNFIEEHPDIDVRYSVDIADRAVDSRETQFTIENSDETEALIGVAAYLPDLKDIDFGSVEPDADLLSRIHEAYPDASVAYQVEILGVQYSGNTEELDLSALEADDVDSVCENLKLLPALTGINLMKEDGTAALGFEDVAKIAEAVPDAAINYEFELFGQTVNASQERLAYRKTYIGDAGVETIRQVLPFMTKLTYFKMDMCGVTNEVCAQLRDDYPDIEVVWRVFLAPGGYSSLTNAEKIWVIQDLQDQYSWNTGANNLQYCTKCKYLDIGHSFVEHIDFVRNMPDLEVLIIAGTRVADLTPLESCTKLEYLEIFSSRNITDLSPLANLTSLEHLNISNLQNVTDITPLYGLVNLKRLRASMNNIPEDQQEEIQRLLPNCSITFDRDHPTAADWRYDENGNYVPRYAQLRETFGYDNYESSTDNVTDD